MLSLWVDENPSVLASVTARLRAAFAGCMTELSAHDAQALPDNRVHFGYRDNIAQPTVIGAPPRKCEIPDDQEPVATGELLPLSKLNDFTYVSSDATQDDTLGLKCPIGSHVRRNNPRNEAIVGTDSTHHRIVRRAMPYGPPYDPAHPDPTPRGLIGPFINASLTNQFEFLTGQWNLGSSFVKSASGPSARRARTTPC